MNSPSASRSWSQSQRRELRRLVLEGRSRREIAEQMGRSVSSVRSAVARFRLAVSRRWDDRSDAFLRAHYRRVPTPVAAGCLRRSVTSVHQRAITLGLSRSHPTHVRDQLETLRRLHAQGWLDPEIAHALSCGRERVGQWRRKLGLTSNVNNERHRRRVAETTKRQCVEAGVASLGQVRVLAFRAFAASHGWPADLRPRAVQILDLLYERGPQTRRQLSDAMGLEWRGSHKSLHSNDPEGSYLAHLMKRGLVVCLGRIVRGQGRGHSVCQYAIPPHVVRGACAHSIPTNKGENHHATQHALSDADRRCEPGDPVVSARAAAGHV